MLLKGTQLIDEALNDAYRMKLMHYYVNFISKKSRTSPRKKSGVGKKRAQPEQDKATEAEIMQDKAE